MTQVLSQLSPTLSIVNYLKLHAEPNDPPFEDDVELPHLLHRFSAVKMLHESQKLAGQVALVLETSRGGRFTCLPNPTFGFRFGYLSRTRPRAFVQHSTFNVQRSTFNRKAIQIMYCRISIFWPSLTRPRNIHANLRRFQTCHCRSINPALRAPIEALSTPSLLLCPSTRRRLFA